MIMLKLDERNAEFIISALLGKLLDIDVENIILKDKVEKLTSKIEELTSKLSCSEFPNNSESGAADNG